MYLSGLQRTSHTFLPTHHSKYSEYIGGIVNQGDEHVTGAPVDVDIPEEFHTHRHQQQSPHQLKIHHEDFITWTHSTCYWPFAWLRHQMGWFSALPALRAGNSPVTGEFPSQKQVTRSFDVLFDLSPNKRLSKQWRRRWFETALHSWRHCNGAIPPITRGFPTKVTHKMHRPVFVAMMDPDDLSTNGRQVIRNYHQVGNQLTFSLTGLCSHSDNRHGLPIGPILLTWSNLNPSMDD